MDGLRKGAAANGILSLWIGLLLIVGSTSAHAADPAEYGIVLMHGFGLRREAPRGYVRPHFPTDRLAEALRGEGFRVEQVEMPWSPSRLLDAPIDKAMAEIDEHAKKLRADGVKRIVVAGHSMGANMALAYGARREGVAAVIGLAPGHHPELQARIFPELVDQFNQTRTALEAGKGDKQQRFKGANCCPQFFAEFSSTPAIYWSYFNPDGDGSMAKNAQSLKPGVPVLWVLGKNDDIFGLLQKIGESYADYVPSRLPPNPNHRRVILDADHRTVPERSVPEVIEWLKRLP